MARAGATQALASPRIMPAGGDGAMKIF